MNKISKVLVAGLLAAAAPSTLLAVTAVPAQAAQYPCGFTGLVTPGLGGDKSPWEKANYNHCGKTNIVIRIQYYYVDKDVCVTPGNTTLYANPNYGALKFAYYLRTC